MNRPYKDGAPAREDRAGGASPSPTCESDIVRGRPRRENDPARSFLLFPLNSDMMETTNEGG